MNHRVALAIAKRSDPIDVDPFRVEVRFDEINVNRVNENRQRAM